jgi:hypothetical protein
MNAYGNLSVTFATQAEEFTADFFLNVQLYTGCMHEGTKTNQRRDLTWCFPREVWHAMLLAGQRAIVAYLVPAGMVD